MENLGLDQFHPVVAEWFAGTIGTPSPPQMFGWPVIAENRHILIAAPTGTGKTLAAFMDSINRLFEMSLENRMPKGVYILYVSPLKALNNDIHKNLDVPLEGIRRLCREKGIDFPNITKAIRTGDTSQRDRAAMVKNAPHILITTPESLYLMLTSRKTAEILKNVQTLIVDEIHSLFGTKRGTHLSVSIERLQAIATAPITRIGLSATVNPLESAALFLGGLEEKQGQMAPRQVEIVAPPVSRSKDLRIVLPVSDFKSIEGHTVWPHIFDTVDHLIKSHRNTIVFTNNRTTAERLAANLNSMNEEEIIRPHHGSMSRESRHAMEDLFKRGELKNLVATATLELGIDIGGVDQMIQIAPPVSVSSGLQRLGRAGHRPGEISLGAIIPRTRNDLLLTAFIAEEMLAGHLERQQIPENCLDILAQHIISMSCLEEVPADEIYRQVRCSYAYKNLSKREFDGVLKMLAGDYEHKEDVPVSPRIQWDRQSGMVSGNTYSRMLAVGSGGTIPDRGYYPVYLEDGKTRLGELDEIFVHEARIGDRFMLGNSAWKVEKIESQKVIVSKSQSVGARVPFWEGDGIGWDYDTAKAFGVFLRKMEELVNSGQFDASFEQNPILDAQGVSNLRELLEDQLSCTGCLPNDKRIIVEYMEKDGDDQKILMHMPFGMRVNQAIAIVLQCALERSLKAYAYASANDMAVMIHLYGDFGIVNPLSLLHASNAEDQLIRQLPRSARFSIAFRYNAYRGMIMGARTIGQRLPLWIQRLRSVDALETASRYKDHPMILETYRDCLIRDLDVAGMLDVLKGIEQGSIEVIEKETLLPSPFARDILFAFQGTMMYNEKDPHPSSIDGSLISSKASLITALNKREEKSELGWHPNAEKEILEKENASGKLHEIASAIEATTYLRIYGDLTEIGLTDTVYEYLNDLKKIGSVMTMEFPNGSRIWLASEDAPLYISAFAAGEVSGKPGIALNDAVDEEMSSEEARLRIFRRLIRYNSPIGVDVLEARYSLPFEDVQGLLEDMVYEGILRAVISHGRRLYYHHKIFERIDRRSLTMKAREVTPEPIARLACFMPQWQQVGQVQGFEPEEALYAVIRQMQGLNLPVGAWESIVFPARLKGYKAIWLDKLCTSGRVFWRVLPGAAAVNAMNLTWYCWEDVQMNTSAGPDEEPALTEAERRIMNILRQRGASFSHVLTSLSGLTATSLFNHLKALMLKGLVVNDSFSPVRMWDNQHQSKSRSKESPETWAGAASRQETGRWELASALMEPTLAKKIDLLLARYGLLCREVFQAEGQGALWDQASEFLKLREYTGELLRGYFSEGLSGIQYMQPKTVQAFQHASGFTLLNAGDPAMVFGRLIPAQASGTAWMAIPGTIVVMKDGIVQLLVERYGERMTFMDSSEGDAEKIIKVLVEGFSEKRIWPDQKKIHISDIISQSVKQGELEDKLLAEGFMREVKGLTLWRRIK